MASAATSATGIQRTSSEMSSGIPTNQPLPEKTLNQAGGKIQDIPQELLLEIFKLLPCQSALTANLVCRDWNTLLADDVLWKCFLRRDLCLDGSIKTERPKEQYRRQYVFASNFARGIFSTKRISLPPGYDQMSHSRYLLTEDGKKLVTLSYVSKNTFKICDLESGRCISTLNYKDIFPNHADLFQVTGAALKRDGAVIIGDDASSIYILDLTGGSVMRILREGTRNTKDLECIQEFVLTRDEKKLISISKEGAVQIWSLERNVDELDLIEFKTAIEPDSKIMAVKLFPNEKMLALGFNNSKIKILNLANGHCEKALETPGRRKPYSFAFDMQENLVVGCADHVIYVYDFRNDSWGPTQQMRKSEMADAEIKLVHPMVSGKLATISFYRGYSRNTGWHFKCGVWDLKQGGYYINTLKGSTSVPTYSLPFASLTEKGELILNSGEGVAIFDFTASSTAVFEELARMFEGDNPEEYEEAAERFLRMPENTRRMIYGELYAMPFLFSSASLSDAENAFHDQNGLSSTPQQKAQAIRNYLNQENLQGEERVAMEL